MIRFARARLQALSLMTLVCGIWLGASISEQRPAAAARRQPEQAAVFTHILAKNSAVAAFLLVGGLTVGILTVCVLFLNGAILGGALARSISLLGGSTTALIFAPHGIVEFTAFVLLGAEGLRIGVLLWNAFRGDLSLLESLETGFSDVAAPVVGSFLLLVLAASIETATFKFAVQLAR